MRRKGCVQFILHRPCNGKSFVNWAAALSDLDIHPRQSYQRIGGSLESRNASEMELETLKDVQLRKLCNSTTEFSWLGSPSTCRKRRRHYKSFQRNGVKISIYDFVYVLAEEDKRLVAYLDDMYEDSKGNKMVVVRWFHKIDEVGIVLPQNYNDREIFFSLCLQDLSIECVDGLAIVLSPLHYEKFLNEATHTQLEAFLCQRQFDNDDVKPFDITQVNGYWKQEILRSMFATYPSKVHLKSQHSNDGLVEGNCGDAIGIRPRKRLRRSKDCDIYLQSANKQEVDACLDIQCYRGNLIGSKGGVELRRLEEGCSAVSLSGKDAIVQKHLQHLTIGSQVEVLSQDSGIRGCWFRALIIKRHKDKVKVQYQDIKDAADEANNLKEWILASRVAISDELGIRICGRTTVRPTPLSSKSSVSWVVNVGSVVDVWWHDGWWEGIIVQKESEDRMHVYFPGEKRESIFGCGDLRPSQEWLGTGWKHIKERPDLATSIFSDLEKKLGSVQSCNGKPDQPAIRHDKELVGIIHKGGLSVKCEVGCSNSRSGSGVEKVKDLDDVRDLSKDDLLARLKWSSRKKRCGRNSSQKLHYSVGKSKSSLDVLGSQTSERFFIPSSLKIDHDNCKFISDSLFTSSVVSPLTSLVMSR